MNMNVNFKKLAVAALSSIALTACVSDSGFGPDADLSQEELVARQARSVHLFYGNDPLGIVSAAAATVTVRESYPGSYYAVLVWDGGYCGIQDHLEGTRAVIFSVWDPVDPSDSTVTTDTLSEDLRAQIVYADPVMDQNRFGGEGSGARTMAGFDWREGRPVRFRVECEPYGENRTLFTCYMKDEGEGGFDWHKLASIATIRRSEHENFHGLGSLYSFVEDFMRDGESAKHARRAEFSNVEAFYDGEWHPITSAVFSGDATPSTNIDAGKIPETGAFFLATGGATTNVTTELWQSIE